LGAWYKSEHGSEGTTGKPGLFALKPLAYNCRQERLHSLKPGDRLWLVSRCPEDQQHYFVGVLHIALTRRNSLDCQIARDFGEFAVVADPNHSRDFCRMFPAEGLLRAFSFESGKAVKTGAHLGQALQAIRFLSPQDEYILDRLAPRSATGDSSQLDSPFGLWTKCDAVFANYFLNNWRTEQKPLAFLLYDAPPVLPTGAPVFIHSDKNLRLVASFVESKYISGYRLSVDETERTVERERIWHTYRASTMNPPPKPDFDSFGDGQHGVRAFFLMNNLVEVPAPLPFRDYGRALEWGYPMGVGYRYLSLSQCILLIRACSLSESASYVYLDPLLQGTKPHF
jgi:hypothetical protein